MSGRVHQLLSGAGAYDAITNQALDWQRELGDWGVAGSVFAAVMEPAVAGPVIPLSRLEKTLAPDDLLILHWSAQLRGHDRVLALPQRKLLVYHNITPPEFLWHHDPFVALVCAVGRERLGAAAGLVEGAAAASEFNAADLRAAGMADVYVDPALYRFDRARLRAGAGDVPPWGDDGTRTIAFVGRLSPNKRQDRLIRAFALYQSELEPDSRLVLVGTAGSGTYGDWLERLAVATGARDVVMPGGIPQPALNAIYAHADVFACLSEHEGFCLPLLEALHFGLPVVASRAGGAVPEIAGDAAVMLDAPDLPTVAEAIDLVVCDTGLRAELARRGERRLERHTPERTTAALRGFVEPHLG